MLAIASHPIQYQSPWFRALAQSPHIDFSVLFVQQPGAVEQGRGFGVAFQWDIPVLEGYPWQVLDNTRGPGGLQGFFAVRAADPVTTLRRLTPDVVILTGWHVWPLLQFLFAARRLGIPVVMRGESNALRERPLHVRLLHRLVLGLCGAFLPIGKASRDFYLRYGIAGNRLFDTPYFVDNERFATTAMSLLPQRAHLRGQWSIPADAICFCYAGKLEPKKRILDLLEALRLAVPASSVRLHLLVVGTGELMDDAHAFVREHQLAVTFTGFLNQTAIPAAYVACDCLVLPSDFGETWGLVVNEAMACGRAAIVSDRVGCGPDLITPGVTGEVFPFGETHALAERLTRLAAAPDALALMGDAARDRVMRHYSVERSVQGSLDAIAHVLGSP